MFVLIVGMCFEFGRVNLDGVEPETIDTNADDLRFDYECMRPFGNLVRVTFLSEFKVIIQFPIQMIKNIQL